MYNKLNSVEGISLGVRGVVGVENKIQNNQSPFQSL